MTVTGEGWEMTHGDCVQGLSRLESDSVHFSVFSPPFADLYVYSDSPYDMGNCKTESEFFTHFGYLTPELHRVMMPGRLVAFHCMQLPLSKERDGVIGLRDFRGALIKAFEKVGFIYHSEVCIWKDPVTAMQRTKALGLLHKQIVKDSAMSRQGIADYLVVMRKRGENPEPVSHTRADFPVDVWQRYASPVWASCHGVDDEGFAQYCTPVKGADDQRGINPSDTLQFRSARQHEDERHICPLQLEVIRRAVRLWSNPGDVVLSPFAGIGSEGVVSLEEGRLFRGWELKESYFKQSVANLKHAVMQKPLLETA